MWSVQQMFDALAASQDNPYCNLMDPADGFGPAGSGDLESASGNSLGWLRQESITLVVFRFPVGISNACAMLQLTCRFEFSPGRPPLAASAPRIGNDENCAGGTGGPATSVIAKVKPKTKRPISIGSLF